MVGTAIPIPSSQLAEFCQRHGISRTELFGSVLREDFVHGRSDIDVLVEFLPGRAPGFFDLVKMEEELSAIFGGNRVDLVVRSSLSRWIRSRVLDEARVIYVAEK